MRRFLILIFTTILIGSCVDNQNKAKEKEEFDALFAEVMVIHDDAMPETNNLYKLKKFAQENIEILPDTSSFVKQLLDAQLKAEKADDEMMEWMANFKIPESDHKSKISYLKNEKIEITRIRDLMLNAIYEGRGVISKSDIYIKKNKLHDERKTNFTPNN